ncbi:MAG: TlpA family protein disulfide reductase [Actinomycetota bacterium]|nr:TlpA family protein disulfide reductase [Actinomycetota bacterium]
MDATAGSPPTSNTKRLTRLAWFLVPGLAFVGLLAFGLMNTTDGPPAPGDPAPAFSAPLLGDAGSLSLEELEGRPVVLNFWASWCGPCRDEAPMLARAHEDLGDDIAFVGVDIRDGRTDALEFQKRYGIAYPSVRDESHEIFDDYGLTGQPETFFIDSEGVIVDHVPGALTEDLLLRELDVLLSRD